MNPRITRLRDAIRRAGLDALFISHPLNVYYLTGFRCRSWSVVQPLGDPEGFLLVGPDQLTFFCDDRYDPAPAVAAGAKVERIPSPPGPAMLANEIKEVLDRSARVVGFEAAGMLHSDAVEFLRLLPAVEWRPADDLMVRLRLIKDENEKKLLREAARITDAAMAHAIGSLRVGQSETDVANIINTYLRTHSEGLAFDSIIAFDAAAAAPHYHPSPDNKLRKGSLVLMDFGGVWEGYHGDLTRCVFMGKADERQREVYHLVLGAQENCLRGLKPGMIEHEADGLCRGYLSERKAADRFIHGTGHGVGLAIHEPPRLKQTLQGRLEPGMAVTVEPGLYYDGWGGIRIEDVVLVTDTGVENITRSPKQLIEVPC